MIRWRHVLPDRLLYYCYCCWWVLVDSWFCVVFVMIDCVCYCVLCCFIRVLWCMLFIEPHTKGLEARREICSVTRVLYCYFCDSMLLLLLDSHRSIATTSSLRPPPIYLFGSFELVHVPSNKSIDLPTSFSRNGEAKNKLYLPRTNKYNRKKL